jgi:hypothetical protein
MRRNSSAPKAARELPVVDPTSEDMVLSRSSAVHRPRGAGTDGELQDEIGLGCSVSYGGDGSVGQGVGGLV